MRRYLTFLLPLFCLAAVSCTEPQETAVHVAAAANTRFAMEEIVAAFSAETGLKADLTVASSGKLTAQIKSGAPFDLFLSANTKYPKQLETEGQTWGKSERYASGSLILWTMDDISLDDGLSALTRDDIKRIAIANPKNAPYGIAAEEAIRKVGLWSIIEEKIVYGESISQVNQYVSSGNAEVGLTALSVVLSKMKGEGYYHVLNTDFYTRIDQGMVKLKHGEEKHPEATEKFWNFMFGEKAQAILKSHGYNVD